MHRVYDQGLSEAALPPEMRPQAIAAALFAPRQSIPSIEPFSPASYRRGIGLPSMSIICPIALRAGPPIALGPPGQSGIA